MILNSCEVIASHGNKQNLPRSIQMEPANKPKPFSSAKESLILDNLQYTRFASVPLQSAAMCSLVKYPDTSVGIAGTGLTA